jgi:sterol desaturase/sphingolipid hydroxylase (fatty acid hydroxylase superfamily)
MLNWPWLRWVALSLVFFVTATAALDWTCRLVFRSLRIKGTKRPESTLPRRRAAVLFTVNAIQVGTALFLADWLAQRGVGRLVERPIVGPLGVARTVAEVLVIFLVLDTNFYWVHRFFHRHKRLFRALHAEHHVPRYPNAWVMSYQHPLDYLLTTVAPMCWVSLLPLSLSVTSYFVALVIANFINIAGHLGYEVSGTFIGIPTPNGWATFLDPSRQWIARAVNNVLHHDLHHQTASRNFSLYFTFWDRLSGTLHPDTDHVERHIEARPTAPIQRELVLERSPIRPAMMLGLQEKE